MRFPGIAPAVTTPFDDASEIDRAALAVEAARAGDSIEHGLAIKGAIDVSAVVPELSGRAWVTGMGQYLLDADDSFPAGFAL